MYYLSRYLVIYPHQQDTGHSILYSTKRGSKILVPNIFIASLKEGEISSESVEKLAQLGFLVPDPEKELADMRHFLRQWNERKKTVTAALIVNLDCNLACPYCYEAGIKGKKYLSAENSRRFINYVEKGPLAAGKNISLVFHGGEPLLSLNLIKQVSEQLKVLAASQCCNYHFNLITNGTLLTRKMVEDLLPFGLRGAKVTLDGPREIHDRFRPFVSGKGSFDVIVNNLKEILDLVKIQIGGNYTYENFRYFPRLLDDLISQGITPDKVSSVQFVPITKTAGEFALTDFRDGCESMSEPWLVEATVFLREEILRRGFQTPLMTLAACMVEAVDDMVVNYDGKIYKCPAFINSPSLAIGDLETGIVDYRVSHDIDAWKNDECLDCAYLPLCFGGCKFMQYVGTGSLEGIDCRKEYFAATLEKFIKQEIQYAKKVVG